MRSLSHFPSICIPRSSIITSYSYIWCLCQKPILRPVFYRVFCSCNVAQRTRVAGRSRRDRAAMAHNTRKCSPGGPGCNFNLIARYFGRAYAYARKVRKGEALLNALGLHAIPHFASTLTSCSSRLAWLVSSCEVEKDRSEHRGRSGLLGKSFWISAFSHGVICQNPVTIE